MKFSFLLLMSCLLLQMSLSAAFAAPSRKVVVIVLENTEYARALKEPAFQKLAQAGILFSNFSAVATVSQPNYIALISGDIWGIKDNKPRETDARSIVDLLEEKGMTWAGYADDYPGQGLPGDCFTQRSYGRYARKHFPFISFTRITSNPSRCAKLYNSKFFASHLSQGQIADFNLFTPNMDNDGHDTGVGYAARWIEKTIFPLMARPESKDITWIFTFDESIGSDFHILTLAVGPGLPVATINANKYNHYSLLRTFEEMWALGTLGRNDAKAAAIPEFLTP